MFILEPYKQEKFSRAVSSTNKEFREVEDLFKEMENTDGQVDPKKLDEAKEKLVALRALLLGNWMSWKDYVNLLLLKK